MSFPMAKIGSRVYPMPSFHTTTATKQAWACHRSKLSTGENAEPPLMWSEVGERALVGPALIKEAEERVAEIREKLKAAQSRQKSYTDKKRREISPNPGEFVYLKVSPIRGTRRFQVQGKLAPRYIGPYQVLKKVGAVTYRLKLPEGMSYIHSMYPS